MKMSNPSYSQLQFLIRIPNVSKLTKVTDRFISIHLQIVLKGCFEFRRKNSSRHHEISLERILSHGKYGIAKDAWTAFRIHVILQPKQNAIPALPVFTALDSNRVYIELTVDDYIKEKPFTTESNHFHLPSRRVDMASEKEPLSAIVDQVQFFKA